MSAPALDVVELAVDLVSRDGRVRAVDGISFSLAPGETLALVGESGCGKSITALSLLRLVPRPPAFVSAKAVRFADHDLLTISDEALRRLRGDRISMIFQEPMTSLNPVLTVGRQIIETLREHRGLNAAAAQAEAVDLLKLVRIPDPERRLKQYPFELSGGMRQRVMIAIALACRPDVLIADEPTTALDVTVQAQILDLLFDLQKRIGTAVILITHDLGVVAQNARRVLVMYAGRIVEEAPVATLFARPLHPYTLGLLASMPRLAQGKRKRLAEIAGTVPVLDRSAPGCAFADRCAHAEPRCREQRPPLESHGPDHRVACLRVDAIARGAL
jgi:oligopeptide/dipeptide ABC transporter ATP-binding protein